MKFSAVVLVIACAIAACVVASPSRLSESQYEHLFTRFVTHFGKAYNTNAFFSRYGIFKANLDRILAHNAGTASYTMGMNRFGDLTTDEFLALVARKPTASARDARASARQPTAAAAASTLDSLAASLGLAGPQAAGFVDANEETAAASYAATGGENVDWRAEGKVAPVKDMLTCGGCYAFASTTAVESTNAIRLNTTLQNLADWQVLECSQSFGNAGCGAGTVSNALDYVKSVGGLCIASSYPERKSVHECAASACKPVATVTGYKKLPQGSEGALTMFATQAVLTATIWASPDYQFYEGGVFDGACSDALEINVNIVGVNQVADRAYYIVRNAWGAQWGEEGYIRVIAGRNKCGIADKAILVTVQ
jgi:hypothetical protein